MKTTKITYWALTGLVGVSLLFSAFSYLTSPQMAETFAHLGFPAYFRMELAIAKLMGVIVLLAPLSGKLLRLKEWAYAAFAIVFVSAFVAHAALGDPMITRIFPIIFLGLLAGSYVTYHKINNRPGQL